MRNGLRDRIYSLCETLSVALTSQKKPGRFGRMFFKFPVLLARLGLSRWMGSSFVIVTTTGRKSGKARRTALSNFGHDQVSGAYYVVSGFGKRSDWCLNLKANPRVHVRVGRVAFNGLAEEVPEERMLDLMREYLRRYPSVARAWSRRAGGTYDGSESNVRHLAEDVIGFALRPASAVNPASDGHDFHSGRPAR